MRNRDLEENIARLQEIVSLWNRFYEITGAVLKGGEAPEELEREFLELKSSIARKYQSLADKFPRRTFPDEEVNGVLSQVVSLSHLKEMTSFAGSELQNQWHKVYIAFNRMLGHLESEKDEIAKVSSVGVLIGKITSSKLFKLIIILLLIGLLAVAGKNLGLIGSPGVEENSEEGLADEPRGAGDYIQDFINRLRRK